MIPIRRRHCRYGFLVLFTVAAATTNYGYAFQTPATQPAAAPPPPSAAPATFRSYEEQTAAIRALVDGSGGVATLEKIATTGRQRTVWGVQLAAPGGRPAAQRPALLLVGGIDADHPASSEIAFEMAAKLLAAARENAQSAEAGLLKSHTFYVVPRANPDGIEQYFEPLKREQRLNARSVDEDRDGVADEDGPNDLNRDGLITVMRVKDPAGEWIVDGEDARLMRKADRSKGEMGSFRILGEGIDDDGDGLLDEDGPGGVDCDRNWPHFFEPGVSAAGLHPMSEPETRGLAEFVLARPNIAAAIVLGRNDNVVSPQKGAAKGPSGQDFKELHPDDVKLYERISERYREITGHKTTPAGRIEGSLYAWLYSQRGIPTFAVNPWWPLDDAPPATSGPTSGPASESAPAAAPPSGASPTAAPPAAAQAPAGQPAAPGAGARPRRGGRGGRPGGPGGGPPSGGGTPEAASAAASIEGLAAAVESSDTLKKWLKRLDETPAPRGFVAWTQAAHPVFGSVEIGGLAPYATNTPPAAVVPELVSEQLKFAHALCGMLPTPRFLKPRVRDLGGGVWQIDVRATNPALLPTHMAISRHIRNPGFTIEPRLGDDRVVAGRRVERFDFLPGGGEVLAKRWLVRGTAGEKITIRAYERVLGEFTQEITLQATPVGQENE